MFLLTDVSKLLESPESLRSLHLTGQQLLKLATGDLEAELCIFRWGDRVRFRQALRAAKARTRVPAPEQLLLRPDHCYWRGDQGSNPRKAIYLGKDVVVRKLQRSNYSMTDPRGLRDFTSSLTKLAALRNPCLASYLGAMVDGAEVQLVYEYIPGISLERMMNTPPPQRWQEAEVPPWQPLYLKKVTESLVSWQTLSTRMSELQRSPLGTA
ncbi:unnamed protein product [Effrenium voratum]|nr:unnamed protein product [Effrenium voratum]